MSEENTAPAPDAPAPDAPVADAPAAKAPKAKKAKKAKSTKARAARTPGFKDWIRVQKSSGNTCMNQVISLVINKATNTCTLVTNAASKEDDNGNPVGPEMEGERKQIFKVTGFEIVDIPEEAPAAPAAK
tara:strand:- start:451 stop:840 length:390 start_codon:yes stop_codon:yes gene_type:complete